MLGLPDKALNTPFYFPTASINIGRQIAFLVRGLVRIHLMILTSNPIYIAILETDAPSLWDAKQNISRTRLGRD